MESEFQITQDDYVAAGLLNGEMTRKSKIIHYTIDAVLVLLGIAAFYADKIIWASGLVGAAIGGNLFPYALRGLYAPWYLKRHYQKYKVVKKPISILLLDMGVKFTTSNGEGLLKWEEMHHWRENSSLILIYLAPKIYHMIPKRIEKSGFSIAKLKEGLIENVGIAT